MLVSQKLAIAAHLHVLLRRKTGRVTDTEWMADNLEYALEIVRFTRAKAEEENHLDLLEWADKLERAVLEPTPGQRPLVQSALRAYKERTDTVTRVAAPAPAPAPAPAAPPPAASDFGNSVFGNLFADSQSGDSRPVKPRDPNAPRYVGGIR